MALCAEVQAERLDKGALAAARYAGDADPDRVAGVRQQLPQHLLAHVEMRLGVAFHQGDGLSQDVAVASQHTGYIFVYRESPPARLIFTRHRYARLTGNAVVTAIDADHDR